MLIARLLAGSAASLLLAASAPPPQDVPKPQAEKKVCKGVRTVGTLMEKRICLTPTEWKQFAEKTRRDADVLRNRGALGRVPSKDGS